MLNPIPLQEDDINCHSSFMVLALSSRRRVEATIMTAWWSRGESNPGLARTIIAIVVIHSLTRSNLKHTYFW